MKKMVSLAIFALLVASTGLAQERKLNDRTAGWRTVSPGWRSATPEEQTAAQARQAKPAEQAKPAQPSGIRRAAGRAAEPYRQATRTTDHEAAAAQAVAGYNGNGGQSASGGRPRTTNAPSPRTHSRMTANDLEAQHQKVKDLTAITVGRPMPFEEVMQYYQGYYGFYGMNLPGSIYPQYSSLQPAQQLPAYIQQELFEEFLRSGEFNPLLPGTGHMGQHLPVLEAEARIGRGVTRTGPDGGPTLVQIGPETWSTTNYVVVSSVGILEETVQGFQFHGDDIVRITESIPGIGSRARRILWDTLGNSQRSAVDRQIVGIVYVAIVDLETRSVLKSSTGVAAMSYTEFASADLPAIRMQSVRYAGAGKFARELVLSALYDETDRDRSVEQFRKRRGKGSPTPTPRDRSRR